MPSVHITFDSYTVIVTGIEAASRALGHCKLGPSSALGPSENGWGAWDLSGRQL